MTKITLFFQTNIHNKNEVIFIISIKKANVSKSLELRQRLKLWLKENLIANRFVTSCRRRYFERHCFFIDDAEVVDVTFDTSHKLAVREYTVIECKTLSDYLRLIAKIE